MASYFDHISKIQQEGERLASRRLKSFFTYISKQLPEFRQEIIAEFDKARKGEPHEAKRIINELVERLRKKQLDISTSALREAYTQVDKACAKYTADLTGVTPSKLTTTMAQKAIGTEWRAGGNFSHRVWKNKQKTSNALLHVFRDGIIKGLTPDQMARELTQKLKGLEYSDALRLVTTELNRLSNEAIVENFEEAGVTEFIFQAEVDSRTSEICLSMNGKRFKANELKIGINQPPLHPNCRSTLIPVIPKPKPTKKETVKQEYTKPQTTTENTRIKRNILQEQASYDSDYTDQVLDAYGTQLPTGETKKQQYRQMLEETVNSGTAVIPTDTDALLQALDTGLLPAESSRQLKAKTTKAEMLPPEGSAANGVVQATEADIYVVPRQNIPKSYSVGATADRAPVYSGTLKAAALQLQRDAEAAAIADKAGTAVAEEVVGKTQQPIIEAQMPELPAASVKEIVALRHTDATVEAERQGIKVTYVKTQEEARKAIRKAGASNERDISVETVDTIIEQSPKSYQQNLEEQEVASRTVATICSNSKHQAKFSFTTEEELSVFGGTNPNSRIEITVKDAYLAYRSLHRRIEAVGYRQVDYVNFSTNPNSFEDRALMARYLAPNGAVVTLIIHPKG